MIDHTHMEGHAPQSGNASIPRYPPASGDCRSPLHSPTAPAPVSVCEPMTVLWQGIEYPVAQWDTHGFTLQRAIPSVVSPGNGRVVDVQLMLGEGETRIQMQVQARAETGDSAKLRYQFIDLGRAQSELLHRVVDYALTKQELSLTQLLNDSRETRVARQETTQKTLAFRTWFQISLACMALAGAAYMALGSVTQVKSRYAAVSVAAANVSVPASGMVSQIDVTQGQHVQTGQTLAYLRAADHDDRQMALSDHIRALEAEQAELGARRTALQTRDTNAAHLRSSERARLEEAVARADRRLALERAQLASLHAAGGLPTLARQQDKARQQALALSAEADLAAAKGALQALREAEALGLVGPQGLTASAETLEALDLRLSHLSREIALAYGRNDALYAGTPVTAPCDCVVAQINRVTGEWAEPAQPMFVLAQSGATAVHALIMADTAQRISHGDRAQIRLADGQQVTGKVARLNYDNNWAGFAGLQNSVFAAERYARVEIIPDHPLDARIGMTAHTVIKTQTPLGRVLGQLGL
ncbi:HlyD family secretion protein [Roseinatronobacter thiooxidans]|nr:HlyD family efflux transporter periplasmic adaptor subunit [Roseinatronobacter thiooxidans]